MLDVCHHSSGTGEEIKGNCPKNVAQQVNSKNQAAKKQFLVLKIRQTVCQVCNPVNRKKKVLCRFAGGLVVTSRTTIFNIEKFYILPSEYISVIRTDLKTNDYFPTQY
jgi:hypothetical protein